MDKPRGKQAYLNYDQIQSYIEQGILDSYDEVFTKDRGIKYYIDDNHNIIEIKSRNDIFNSESQAITKLNNLSTDYFAGQLISIKNDEDIYLAYMVNYDYISNQYSISRVCENIVDYNRLDNIPIVNITADDVIDLSQLPNGYYKIIGNYIFSFNDPTTKSTTSRILFVIEHVVEDNEYITYITEIKASRINRYRIVDNDGSITDDRYVLYSELADKIDEELDEKIDGYINDYVDENRATDQDVRDLFNQS